MTPINKRVKPYYALGFEPGIVALILSITPLEVSRSYTILRAADRRRATCAGRKAWQAGMVKQVFRYSKQGA